MKKLGAGITWAAVLVLFFASAGESWADKIVLENGDTLTGTVEKVLDGKLTLVTDYAGAIVIPVAKIKQVVTDHPVAVHLKDGEVLKGKVRTVEDKTWAVESSPERTATLVKVESVKAVNPPPVKWTGSVSAGGNLQSGNTDRAGAFINAEASRRTEQDRIGFRYLFNYGEEDDEVTTRNHYGSAKYDYFFTPKFYGYGAVELLNDEFQDTKLKTFIGPGIGYQVWEDAVKSLLFEAGLTYFNWDRYDGEDEDGISARLALDFKYSIFSWLAFGDRFQFYPTLGEGGLYFWRNEAALSAPLSPRWSLKLANILDFNSDPAPGIKKTDVQWLGGLQFSF